jgi:hypothetical protein
LSYDLFEPGPVAVGTQVGIARIDAVRDDPERAFVEIAEVAHRRRRDPLDPPGDGPGIAVMQPRDHRVPRDERQVVPHAGERSLQQFAVGPGARSLETHPVDLVEG